METFSFEPTLNFSENGKWLLAVAVFEATNSVFIIFDENNKFSTSTAGHWPSKGGAKTLEKLLKI